MRVSTLLASGASVQVYRAGSVAVRVATPRQGEEVSFQSDAQIRRLLHAAGQPVSVPLKLGILPGGVCYSLDTFVQGEPCADLSEHDCRALGGVLSALHTLPCSHFGLLQDRSDMLAGHASSFADGLRTRLNDAWPYGTGSLEHHPLTGTQPAIWPRLRALHRELLALKTAPVVVCHTDLHSGQLLWIRADDGTRRLSALLDFGDAACGPVCWDVASFAYFHGWERADWLRDGLSSPPPMREAALFGVLLAFHRARRAHSLKRPADLHRAQAFLAVTLERLTAQAGDRA
ncbi:aminoglycoside phosphotransferase family protein [Deinococcus sp. KNUC1210]|uniref:aminoglycoside phosphotransferase family protein n=1 Tax=Deinococcus sp. KNUC1210 TaxID=2917691 RepID=UPI001EF01AED|nr:aminoglycoside phosphotransferase family protein [Deinococcus sp. KNUC1210]ULH16344.1 aminoglycoside phosphotransferase family protein [Deinococcus sp. KNUC1210]